MKTCLAAMSLVCLGFAQDVPAQPAVDLAELEGVTLAKFIIDKLDSITNAEELEKAILGKIEEIKKARSGSTETQTAGKKRKRANAATAKKGKRAAADALYRGLNDADLRGLGKFVVAKLNEPLHGQALLDAIKKEIDRLKEERGKATTTPKKKKRKKNA